MKYRSQRKETTITETELERLAESFGIRIDTDYEGELAVTDLGGYFTSDRRILIRPGLGAINRKCVIAHELAHALRDDSPTGHPHFDQRMERATDRLAAALLISPIEYATAEILYGPHEGAIAKELGVTKKMLTTWREAYERKTSVS